MKNNKVTIIRRQLHIASMDLLAAYKCNWSRDARDTRIDEAEMIVLQYERAFVTEVEGAYFESAYTDSVRQRAEHYATPSFARSK